MRISKTNATAKKLPCAGFVDSTRSLQNTIIRKGTAKKKQNKVLVFLKDQKRPQNHHLENSQRKKITYQV